MYWQACRQAEAFTPLPDTRVIVANCVASAGVVLVLARTASVPLLGLGEAQACLRLLECTLELLQALRTRLRLSKSPCFVELVALARVSGICAQNVEPIGWHAIGWHASQYAASRGAASGVALGRYAARHRERKPSPGARLASRVG